MLIDASDYTYNAANIATSEVVVQGRIIPTEDVAGQVHPLRRENLAYLCEMISERKAEAYWSVPSANAAVNISDVKTLGDAIRDLYSHNAANQGAQPRNFFPADVTAADFAAASVSFSASLGDTYPGQLLKLSDCAVPSDVPSNLSADYLRKCFYAANEMRFRAYALYGRGGTMGGTRKIAGYRENVDGDGNVTITQISDSAACPAAFSKDEDRSSGYFVSVGGYSHANSYAYYFSDPPPATSPLTVVRHDEIWYEGSSGAIMLSADVPTVYHDTKVMFIRAYVERRPYEQAVEGKYVLMPITFNVSTSAGSDVIMTTSVDKAFWQSLALVAFPQASFTLNGSGVFYGVRSSVYNYIVELKYPSSLPDVWTWTPT